MFQLHLFGVPRLSHNQVTIDVDARKTMALLAYLAVTGDAHGREVLMALLWPDLDTRRAQNVLRRNLSMLNKALGKQWLVVNKNLVWLDDTAEAWVDVQHFRSLARSWQTHAHESTIVCHDCLADLAAAAELYRADFLSGFSIRNSITFDEWQSLETENLRREYASVLERLVAGHRIQKQFSQAIVYAQKWLALDHLHEPAHQQLIQLYHEAGNRLAAARQYEQYVHVLEEELGVTPNTEMAFLDQHIQQEPTYYGKVISGEYAIVEGDSLAGLQRNLIGSGGMGNVYRGIHLKTGRAVAIKTLKPDILENSPELVKRFIHEGEILKELNHPNIVKMLAASQDDGEYHLVMEFVNGGSLQNHLAHHGALSIETCVKIALDLADALTRAHKLGIIHRDLKPANILLTEDNRPRLTDFGIARRINTTQRTDSGMIIGTTNYLSPEAIEGQPLDERSDIWGFGVILYEMLTGKHPFKRDSVASTMAAILSQPMPQLMQLRPDVPIQLAKLIEQMLVKDTTQRLSSVRLVGVELEAIMADRTVTLRRITSLPSAAPPPSPYRGLFAFQIEDAPYFFGREAFGKRLLAAVHQQALAAVVGSSGSGKSSVVFAGLTASLQDTEPWLIASFRPGGDPFQSIAAALLPLLQQNLSETDQLIEVRKLREGLYQEKILLDDIVSRILQKHTQTKRLILIADQFEELYTLSQTEEMHARFLDMVLDLTELQSFQKDQSFGFILTLRADFLEQALTYRPFADALQDNIHMLGPMDQEELVRAIEQPAALLGVNFEAGLVERILDDVGDEAGNLPLLEFALTILWEQQQYRLLTHAGYESIGRVAGALTTHAEQTFANLRPDEHEAVRRVMVQLVQPGEGTEDTRRIAYKADLNEEDWHIVQRLADSRLVTTGRNAAGDETVEVVHEALIRSWIRIRSWMSDVRGFRIWQERLRAAVNQWQSLNQDEGALLRGLPLLEAEKWLAEQKAYLSQTEQQFILSSVRLQERVQVEQEQTRLNRERQRQQVMMGAIVGLIIAVVLAVFAALQWRAAAADRQVAVNAQATAAAERDQSELAQSGQLAALTLTELDTHLDLALLLAIEATHIADTEEARSILRHALVSNPSLKTYFWGHTDFVTSVAVSPDGRRIASGSNDDMILLWDTTTNQRIGFPLVGHTDNVVDVAFSPDGQFLASASSDKTIRLWEVETGRPIGSPLRDHDTSVTSVTFSPDGQQLVSSGGEIVILWDLTNINTPNATVLTGHKDIVRTVAFSPDGTTIASGGNDQTILLWDAATGTQHSSELSDHKNWIRSLSFSPDGELLATADEDGFIYLWHLDREPILIRILKGHTNSVRSVAFASAVSETSDDYLLASGGVDGSVILWHPTQEQPIQTRLDGHTDWVRDIGFSPDGQTLYSAGHDLAIITWHTKKPTIDPLLAFPPLRFHTDSVRSLAFHPSGKQLISGDNDGQLVLWQLSDGQFEPQTAVTHGDNIRSMALSPDGRLLATGSADGTITVWSVNDTLSQYRTLLGHNAVIHSVAFSADGQTVASASEDATVLLWDVETGQPLGQPLLGHTAGVQQVAFSPDGQWLASAGDDNRVLLRDVSNISQVAATLLDHRDVVFGLAFSPNSQTLASSSWDRTVILWDVSTGQPLALPLEGHTESIQSVTFSSDGRLLASASWDETVILWDAVSGKPLGSPILGHARSVRTAIFSPDNHFLASSGDDGTIFIWDVSLQSWQSKACQRANRDLSKIERQRFFGNQQHQATCPPLLNTSE